MKYSLVAALALLVVTPCLPLVCRGGTPSKVRPPYTTTETVWHAEVTYVDMNGNWVTEEMFVTGISINTANEKIIAKLRSIHAQAAKPFFAYMSR